MNKKLSPDDQVDFRSQPSSIGPLQRREIIFAYALLLPTFAIVFAIVLFPLLTNFWISFKTVQLADLRPAQVMVNERLKGKVVQVKDKVSVEYRLRNSSRKNEIREIVMRDLIPYGLQLVLEENDRCELKAEKNNQLLICRLGDFPAKHQEKLILEAVIQDQFLNQPVNLRESVPTFDGSTDNILLNLQFTLQNYRRLFHQEEFWQVFRTTVYYTVFGTVGALVLGLLAAQLLHTYFPGRGFLRGLFLFPYVAPVIAVAFTWIILLDPFSGTLNALFQHMGMEEPINFFGKRSIEINLLGFSFQFPLALTMVILFEVWRYFPLSFLFILARMQSISQDMYEAAEMDGATPLQKFSYISLPQLVGILGILFLLRFIWTFNKFDDIFLLTGGGAGTRTLTVDVYEQGFALSDLGSGAAVAVVVFILLLIFSLCFFKFFSEENR